MRFSTLSAIVKGTWLIDPSWASMHAPLIFDILEGKSVDLGQATPHTKDDVIPLQISARGYKVGRYSNITTVPEGSVAIVDLIGPVVRYGDMCSSGLEDTAALLRRLDSAGNIVGIILNVNTPGGEASGTAMFASLIKSLTKPIIGFVDDGIAASAGMWAISACTEIYATNKQSAFGSIGAYTMLPDFLKFYEAKGLKIHEIYARQSGDKNKDYREAMNGNYDGMQDQLSELVTFFIDDVKANRAGKLNAKAGDPFTGKMFKAEDAKKIGLIDGFKNLEQVVARVHELSQKSKSKTTTTKMASTKKYPALATAAGWTEGYETTEEGVHLTHEDAAAVDAALAQGTTDAAAVAAHGKTTEEHQAAITGKDQKIQELTTQLEASKADANEQRALAVKYGAETAGKGTVITTSDDPKQETTTKKVHPFTAEAMNFFGKHRA